MEILPAGKHRSRLAERLPVKILLPLAAVLITAAWLVYAPVGLLGKADAVGYAVCHRIDVRSFHLGERQLPLCARCSGMYLGVLAGLVVQNSTGRGAGFPRRGWLAVFAGLAAAFAVDGANSYWTLFSNSPLLYQPSNLMRLVTGTGMGLAVSAAVLPAFRQTLWQDYDNRPAFGGWRQALLLGGAAAALVAAVLWQNPLLLYPLALISAAGVLILLGMVYAMIWVMAFRQENRYHSLREAWLPLCAGLATAVLQVFVIDAVRLAFTGVWAGFSL